jgi:hypothetical protein
MFFHAKEEIAMKVFYCLCLVLLLFLWSPSALAGELAERLANFPQWNKLTLVEPAKGDLSYPEWMAGEWSIKSTLVDLAAPLAPDIVTPGFEGNKQFLNQPISFRVKFLQETTTPKLALSRGLISGDGLKAISQKNKKSIIVADRAFNGLNLARAYLGDDAVIAVKTDPTSPNRQITFLRGDRQLVSIVTARATESLSDGKYITSEAFQQLFKGTSNPYFNTVESTTAYEKLNTTNPEIIADQVTAVYLSPQDQNYFKAASNPVALYRYRLEFYAVQ